MISVEHFERQHSITYQGLIMTLGKCRLTWAMKLAHDGVLFFWHSSLPGQPPELGVGRPHCITDLPVAEKLLSSGENRTNDNE